MAAKTLNEVIVEAMCIGPVSTFQRRLVGEVKNFFAHEVMRYEATFGQNPTLTEENKIAGAMELFDRVFKKKV